MTAMVGLVGYIKACMSSLKTKLRTQTDWAE